MLNSLAIEVLLLLGFDDGVQSIPVAMRRTLVDLASLSVDKQPLRGGFGVNRHDDSTRVLLVVMSFAVTRYVVKQVGRVLSRELTVEAYVHRAGRSRLSLRILSYVDT
jgi:hypothetical protein